MNTEPHQKCSSRKPPVTGPSATAMPATPDHRSDGERALARVGEDVGEDRQRRRHDERGADAHDRPRPDQRADAAGERGRAPTPHRRSRARSVSAPLRPNRSPRLPAVSSRPANTSVYASTTHWRSLTLRAEVAHQRGQRHVDDRVVDHDHEQAHAQDHERRPAASVHPVVRRPPSAGSPTRSGMRPWRRPRRKERGVGHGNSLLWHGVMTL